METKINELLDLLDKNEDIIYLESIKNNIPKEVIELINNYRNNPTVENKTKLYDNSFYKEYILHECNLNYLLMEINKKFKRSKNCENY